MKIQFAYKTAMGKIRKDISVDAPDREKAIACFETEFPELKWYEAKEVED